MKLANQGCQISGDTGNKTKQKTIMGNYSNNFEFDNFYIIPDPLSNTTKAKTVE